MTQGPKSMMLESRCIGDGYPTFLIAEVGQGHDGSLGMAHAYIEAAAGAGVDAIKFQTHIAEAESTVDEPWRVKFSYQDETRFGYWRRMSFSNEQWQGLAEHAREKGLTFLSSPFSLEALELLEGLGVPAWKLASGEVNSRFLRDAMVATGKPLLVSTGMSPWAEIDTIVERLDAAGASFALFQCTSQYPTDLKHVGLNVMQQYASRYRCPVGLSDHTGNINVLMAAIARGANLIEAHITFDRRMFGPDTSSSLTVDEFKSLALFRNTLAVIDSNPVDKDQVARELSHMRKLFMRSVALRRPQSAGTYLTREMLTLKKPSTGINEDSLEDLIGRRLLCDVTSDRLLTWKDLE